MRSLRITIQLAFLIGSAMRPGVAFAQDADSVYTIGEITVTATREGISTAVAPQRVTVLDAGAVQSSGARDLGELLAARTSLFIRQYSEGLSTVSLRGAGASQTAILIDGLRLSDPQLGQFDLSLLPSYLIRGVEVVHGPTSALYGADGLSGAINLRSREAGSNQLSLLTEVGAYGERGMSGGITIDGPIVSGRIAAEYTMADGDFPYLNESLFPPREVRRRNADRVKRSVFGTLAVDAEAHRASLSLLYAGANRGLPGTAGSPSPGERQWDDHFRIWLKDDVRLEAGRLSLAAYLHRSEIRYVNPQLELDDIGMAVSVGAEAVRSRPLGPHIAATYGVNGGYATARHPSLPVPPREIHGAAFGSASVHVAGLRLYPAVRADVYRTTSAENDAGSRAAISPRLGINLPVVGRLLIKSHGGTAFRMPTFNDRYWQPGGKLDLRPERSRSIDAGVYFDGAYLTAEATVFRSRTTDQIVWQPGGGGIWSPDNLLEVVSTGLEASARWRPLTHVTVGGLYGYTRSVDRSETGSPTYGRQVRYVPIHQLKAFADATAGPLHASIHTRYIGKRYVTSDESESLAPVFTMDGQLGLERTFGALRARLSLLVENVLDARYALIQNYPMPPRHARIRLLIESSSE